MESVFTGASTSGARINAGEWNDIMGMQAATVSPLLSNAIEGALRWLKGSFMQYIAVESGCVDWRADLYTPKQI